jgi:hypothetical protein
VGYSFALRASQIPQPCRAERRNIAIHIDAHRERIFGIFKRLGRVKMASASRNVRRMSS